MRRAAPVLAAVAITLIWAPAASAFDCGVPLDKFNRADSATLGSAWNAPFAGIGVQNKAATNPAFSEGLATFRGRKAAQACADVSIIGSGTYVALVLGYGGLADNLFVKVQDNNGSGDFDTAYFYRGNNGDDLVTDQSVKALAPFVSGRIHLLWSGSKLQLDIDTDFDNRPEQTVRLGGFATSNLGTGVGLGIFGGAVADNFAIGLPETRITSSQVNGSKRKASFRFASDPPATGFSCKLDSDPYRNCGSPKAYRHLGRGQHTFRVRARDWVGNQDPQPARMRFTI